MLLPVDLVMDSADSIQQIFLNNGAIAMRIRPELDPDVDDSAPTDNAITIYDEQHFVTYMRLLDAEADGADWREVALIVLHRDPAIEETRTRRCWESHLARARWMTTHGYRHLLRQRDEPYRFKLQ